MTFPSFFSNLRKTFEPIVRQTGKLLRPAAWPIIKALRQFGLGYQQTQKVLEDVGLVEPNTKFYNQTTADYQMLEHETELRALDKNAIPNFDMLTEHDFGRAEHYRWIVKILAINQFTGGAYEQFVSVYTNELMSSNSLIDSIDFHLFEGGSSAITRVLNWEIYAIQHNPGAPYGAL